MAAQHNELNLPITNHDMAAVWVATHVTTEKPAVRKLIAKHPQSTTITDTELVNVNMKKPHKKKNQGKENRVEVDEDDKMLAKGQIWSSDDKTTFFEWLLGANSTVFNIHKTNPDQVFQKVCLNSLIFIYITNKSVKATEWLFNGKIH